MEQGRFVFGRLALDEHTDVLSSDDWMETLKREADSRNRVRPLIHPSLERKFASDRFKRVRIEWGGVFGIGGAIDRPKAELALIAGISRLLRSNPDAWNTIPSATDSSRTSSISAEPRGAADIENLISKSDDSFATRTLSEAIGKIERGAESPVRALTRIAAAFGWSPAVFSRPREEDGRWFTTAAIGPDVSLPPAFTANTRAASPEASMETAAFDLIVDMFTNPCYLPYEQGAPIRLVGPADPRFDSFAQYYDARSENSCVYFARRL